MKKVWENPELNGLGVSETKEATTIVRYEALATSDIEGRVRYKCLGVFDVETYESIQTCGLEFDTWLEWAAHAEAVHVGSVLQGQGNGWTPVS